MDAASVSLLPLSLPKHTTSPSPLFFNLIPFPRVYKFFTSNCTCKDFKKRASIVTNVVYTEREAKVTQQRKNAGSNSDEISLLNERIRKDQSKREVSKTVMNSEEADKYIKLVKEQQQRGLHKLKGDKEGGFSYKVDPYTLLPGDCVVHKKVGVGRFVGIKFDASKDAGQPIEYVFIEYADGMAKLPVKQAARMLYRYNLPNEDKKQQTLSKLNDTSVWEKRRIKGKIAIQKMVVGLMELYLHRLKQKRPPYPKATGMAEFYAQFPYEPTPDQKQAFIDVEKDLTERDTPMDRLICGDVGFGKTEVALRAIFCVISAGKQAMVLAPTIVLAKQHFNVISERFSQQHHIKVGLLSRFQTRAEKEEYISMIKSGELNIIVGTHALLGSRIVYNNLGLLVVDEEQRFGVKQKEKIATFKTSIDVLTLSATPIPRTLYLALTGFRDASLVTTPPPERVPIKTHLSAYSEEKILAAIKFELDRGGKVFYVLPRIKGLEEAKDFLEQSFPNLEIDIAHGKQYSKQLEEAMENFAQGETRILICTNIVESGLDIQDANTIIIQDVHLFGLAQLYQLRGRVGRADKEAYAYLFYPDKSLLTAQALERLAALEECQDLGKGFHLAQRDMGIRGFGSIFGEQQTGDIGNVGIDLFFEMLFESLSKVDDHRIISVPYQSVQFDINIPHHLPSEYINYLENPLEILNEVEKAAEKDMWSLMEFTENLRRHYGKEPPSMEILLKKVYVRRMEADLGITRVYASGKMIGMTTNMSKKVFKLMKESITSDMLRDSLSFENKQIKSKSDGSDSGEENLSKKDLALQQALDQITTSFGKGAIMWLGRSGAPRHVPVVSTGSFSLDMALGIGGLPKGRVVEIYGPEASGKTTLALHVIAESQKTGGYCVFVDAEHALDPGLAEAIGVNTENLLLSQPDSGEQALSLVDTLIRSGSVDVVVVDSVAALVPKGELDGEMGDAHMAMQARIMSQALRKLSHSLSMSQTILIFTNQIRSKLSTFGFGGPSEVTSGGNALKFYASVRLNVRRIGMVKKGEETVGSQVLVKIIKNKHAPPFKTAQFELEFGKGISRESELVDLGTKHKFIIKGGGAFYSFNGQNFRGKDALKKFLAENESIREELTEKLREKLMHTETEKAKESETESPDEEPKEVVIVSPDAADEDAIAAVEA